MRLHRGLLSLSLGASLLSCTVAIEAQPPDVLPPRLNWEPVDVLPPGPWEPVVFDPKRTPQGAIENFVNLYNKNQWHTLPDLIAGAEQDLTALDKVVEQIAKARGTLTLRVADGEIETEGDEAVARLTVQATDHVGMSMAWRETLKLHRENVAGGESIWKLRPSETRGIDSAFDAYLQRLITLIAHPKTLFIHSQRVSANQVKQLVLGVKQFVQDHDEQFAFTPETVKARIRPYIRDDSLWTAPGDAPGTQSYSLNPHLVNANEANIEFIADTVLFYLGRDEKLDFRYDGKTVVGFADGHVELLTEEQAKKLRWEP